MRFLHLYSVHFFIAFVKCNHKEETKSKNPLPYFRRQVEGVSVEDSIIEGPHRDDSQSKLVSFFIKNVREIFNDDDATELYLPTTTTITSVTHEILRPTIRIIFKTIEEDPKLADDFMRYQNMSPSTLIDSKLFESFSPAYELEPTEKNVLRQLTKDLKSMEKSEQFDDNTKTSISSLVIDKSGIQDFNEPWRSCIFCNNVISEDCNDPQNKLIESVICDRDSDVCYSQHTPFGVIDRGCFNVNHNLTTYVCSCNLCNYISISEMPLVFSNKRDWVDNVIELSRTRSLRKSVFKNMACLHCEVNTTKKKGDILDSANCLEGNIGSIPSQICEENEVCAVKAVKSEGYIWRGCVRTPLYNYWWALCDSDLCNYDTLVSVYDFV